MKRIVQVAGSAGWGGGERQLLDLWRGLDRSRYELRFVCPEPGPFVEHLRRVGAPVEVVRLAPLGRLKPARRLEKLLRDWNPALVQSHGARSNFYTRMACSRLGVPNVSTVHNSLFDYPVNPLRKTLYLAAERLTSARATAIVCVCESLRYDLSERLGVRAGALRVIYNGVDLDRFRPGAADRAAFRAELGVGPGEWLVGVLGRLTAQKGHALFLDAFEKQMAARPKARAVLVGDGPLEEELRRRLKAPGLAGRVFLRPPRSDVPSVLAGLDALALPSQSEGLPYVLLEAMAMKIPAAASRVNGVPEIVADGTGLLVEAGDRDGWARALGELQSDREAAARRAERGAERVRKVFALPLMLQAWSNLYDELAR